MSEPDAVPLPRDGEVFFDVRGEARSMRLSWYADSKVAVFSIWQGNRCTGTFRLPFVDLARMAQTLQSGPPVPANQLAPQPGQGYSATVAAYGPAPAADIQYEHDQRYDYGAAARQDFGAAASHQVDDGYPASQDFGAGRYGADQAYGSQGQGGQGHGGQGYGAGHDFSAGPGRDYGLGHSHAAGDDYGSRSGFAAAPSYGADRSYGGDPYHPSDSHSMNEPYHGSEQYRPAAQYRPAEQHRQGEPHWPLRHGADQTGHGLPDYEPPPYGDLPPYRDERDVATGPAATPRPDDWLPPAVPARSKRSADSESAPDTAMMGFPSVPARNGTSGYR